MIVTVCPMCQINLDAYQGEMNARFHTNYKMPILFFTQLMGARLRPRPEGARGSAASFVDRAAGAGEDRGPGKPRRSGHGTDAPGQAGQACPADAAAWRTVEVKQ